MSANFLSLPGELRNNIYEQLLVLQESISCPTGLCFDQSPLGALTLGLLRVNKTVHLEASSILYAQNRFDFTFCISEEVASFLEQIGRQNASYILHICAEFPRFYSLDLHNIALEDDSVRILAKIKSHCTKLGTLTTTLPSTNRMELRLDELDHPEIVGEALALVDARFRVIPSLQEIIVEVYEEYEDGPSDRSDFDRSVSDIEFEDDDYRYDDDSGGNDYDIDNDIDFWRRAGD